MRKPLEPKERINRATSVLVETVKRTVTNNVNHLVKTNQLQVDKRIATNLMLLLVASIDEGYLSYYNDYMKVVDVALEDATSRATTKKKRPSTLE